MPSVQYIDLGINSAAEFWTKVVEPDYDQFKQSQSARDAVHAAMSAWHLLDWLFHEQPAGTQKPDFQQSLLAQCPQLAWVRDFAEAVKHRGLNRMGIEVQKIEPENRLEIRTPIQTDFGAYSLVVRGISPVSLVLEDGSTHEFSDVLEQVMSFWRAVPGVIS